MLKQYHILEESVSDTVYHIELEFEMKTLTFVSCFSINFQKFQCHSIALLYNIGYLSLIFYDKRLKTKRQFSLRKL